ncbi:hypothetical protein V8J88_14565 [Massilia sp. W12]|uniref:hypothetical protein n=1 Tax=Massilia sp. W12 TaxID=3126507 RepID=UPI0030CDDCC0
MVEITVAALIAAIEALDEKIWRLIAERDQIQDDELAAGDMDDIILSYMKSAVSLRESYQLAQEMGFNMTPYEKLVKSVDLLSPMRK